MKKFFTMLAIAASTCLSLTLTSCGNDDDPTIVYPTADHVYTVSYLVSGNGAGQALSSLTEYLQTKLGRVAKVEQEALEILISTKDKEKTEAIIKALTTDELDELFRKIDKLVIFSFDISYNKETIYEYTYHATGTADVTGTYAHTETIDGSTCQWVVTFTNEPGKAEGEKKGIVVLPRTIGDVEAGTYEGDYRVSAANVLRFKSYATTADGDAAISLNMNFGDPEATTYQGFVLVDGETILSRVDFEKN